MEIAVDEISFVTHHGVMNLKAAAVIAEVKGLDIARRFDVTPGTVSKWLSRQLPIPDRHKADFAAMLRIRIDDLLPDSKTESENAVK